MIGPDDLVLGLQRGDHAPVERKGPDHRADDGQDGDHPAPEICSLQRRSGHLRASPARRSKLELQDRDDDDEHEQRHRDGRRPAALVLLKGALKDVVDQHHVVVRPPARREEVDLIEDLQLRDQLDGEHQRRDRPEQRPGDAAERRPAAGIVERRGLVDLARDRRAGPARNSRIEKPAVHQMVTTATAGMNHVAGLGDRNTLDAQKSRARASAMPNWKFSTQSQIR